MGKSNRPLPNEHDTVDLAIAEAMAADPPRNLRREMRSLQSFPWRTSAVQSASSLEDWLHRQIYRVQYHGSDNWARLGCDPSAIDFLVKVRIAISHQ